MATIFRSLSSKPSASSAQSEGEQHALGEVPGGAEEQQAICRQVHAKDRGIMQRYPWLQRLSAQEPACQSAAFLFFGVKIVRVFPPGQNSEAQGRIGSIIKQRAAGSFVSTSKPLRRDHEKGPRKGACLLYTSPSPRDRQKSRMPSSA